MSLIFALAGDAFALVIMWRARAWVFGKRQGMFETDSDAKMRRIGGIVVWIICVISMVANHMFL